jgi:NAD(P)H-dependent flavin oxidoreductase YrpB (nitropropane dioxygenase family)
MEHPVIGGCMQWLSGPDFTAAVCEAGALGIMSTATFPSGEEFREALRRLKSLTDRPFAVNFNLFPALRPVDNRTYLAALLEEGGAVAAEFSGNRPPTEIVEELKSAGLVVMHKCTSLRHALTARRLGADVVTIFGYEGGGHISTLGLTTLVLVPSASEALDVPVVAAGGIVDGRGLAAALALGAEGVLLGTRLMLSEECPLHPDLKQALLAARETDTMPVLGTVGNTLRCLRNRAAERAAELEEAGASFEEVVAVAAGANTRRMMEEGDSGAGLLPVSEAVGLVHEIKPVREIVAEMVGQAEDIFTEMNRRTKK